MTGLYTTLNLTMSIPVFAAAGLTAWRLRGAERRAWLVGVAGALVILLVLTAVFDNLMIAAGLVAYDDALTSGIHIGLAPIEDFAYAIAAAVFVPSAWALLTARRGEAPSDGAPAMAATPGPTRRGLLATLFWSSRPISWINTAAPFALAYLLATGGFDLRGVVGTLFFLVPYNLAMYGINDVFDYESDLRNPRKGGVEGSVLERTRHRATLVASVVTTVPFLAYLVPAGTPESSLWLAASAFAVVAYSARGLRFKEIPFLDSTTSAFHFTSPAIVGWTLAGAPLTGDVWACLVAFLLWGAASQAFGAVQDVRFDREAGLRSVATVLGARATVWFALARYVAAMVVLLVAAPWPASGAAAVVLPYLATVAAYARVEEADAERTNEGWKRFLVLNGLAGFCVTQLVLWSVLVWN